MRITARAFNQIKFIAEDTQDRKAQIASFQQLLHKGLKSEGLSDEVSSNIVEVLIALKCNHQTLGDQEIDSIVLSLRDGLIELKDLMPWVIKREQLIAYIDAARESIQIERNARQEERPISSSASRMPSEVDSLYLELANLMPNTASFNNLSSLMACFEKVKKLSLSNLAVLLKKTGVNGENILMLAAYHYPDVVPVVIELLECLPKNEQIMILNQVSSIGSNILMLAANGNPEVMAPLIALINKLEDLSLKVHLFKTVNTHRWNALMYLVEIPSYVDHYSTNFSKLLSPEPVILFIESMRHFSEADKKAIFEQGRYDGQTNVALSNLMMHHLSFSVPILTKMIEILPSYAATIAEKLTPKNFAMSKLNLQKPGALLAFVNLLLKLDSIPAYKKSDWEKLIKQEKDSGAELALLKLLLVKGVMHVRDYIAIVGVSKGMLQMVALYQENEQDQGISDIIKTELQQLLTLAENGNSPEYSKDIYLGGYEIFQPIPAEGNRVERMLACQAKYATISNPTHLLYAWYCENAASAIPNEACKAMLTACLSRLATAKKEPHIEARMALALIAQQEHQEDKDEWVAMIVDSVRPTPKRLGLFATKPDPISQALVFGTPLVQDKRKVSTFIEAYEEEIKAIISSSNVILSVHHSVSENTILEEDNDDESMHPL